MYERRKSQDAEEEQRSIGMGVGGDIEGGRMERRDEKEREESLKGQNKAWLFGLILED